MVPNQIYAENGHANATPPKQVLEYIRVSLITDSSHAHYSFEQDMQSTEMSGISLGFADCSLYNWVDWDGNEFSTKYVVPLPGLPHTVTLAAYLANQ